uniref:Uncharacterized protein n=1 Tax=viral metagenome TaxID=1070528 RepID=A0A2V0RKV4_9ZZZZ
MNYTKMMEDRCRAIHMADRTTWIDGGVGLLQSMLALGTAWYVQDLPLHRVWATQDEDYESLADLEEGKFYSPTGTTEFRDLTVEIAEVAAGILRDVIVNLDHVDRWGQEVKTISEFWCERYCKGAYSDNDEGVQAKHVLDSFLKEYKEYGTGLGLVWRFASFNGMPTVQWTVGNWSGLLRPFVTDLSDEKPEMVHTHKCLCMQCGLDLDASEEIFFLDEGKPSATDSVKCGCGKGVKTRFILATSGKRGLSKFTTNQPGSYGAVETTLHLPGCTNPYCSMPNRAITRRLFDQRGNDWRKLKQNVFRMEAREKARRKRRGK